MFELQPEEFSGIMQRLAALQLTENQTSPNRTEFKRL